MASFYTIVQYVPNPIADERMNIGVIAYDDSGVYARFLRNWRRAKAFGSGEVAFLKDFAATMEASLGDQRAMLINDRGAPPQIDRATIEAMAGSWANSVQLTDPRASLQDPRELLAVITRRFLLEHASAPRDARDRRIAAKIAAEAVRDSLERRGQDVLQHYFHRNRELIGAVLPHRFDVVVMNGKPFYAAQGISFEGSDERSTDKEVAALAWAFEDVREEKPDMPLALVALPPKRPDYAPFDRAKKMASAYGVEMLSEAAVRKWAERMAQNVPADPA